MFFKIFIKGWPTVAMRLPPGKTNMEMLSRECSLPVAVKPVLSGIQVDGIDRLGS